MGRCAAGAYRLSAQGQQQCARPADIGRGLLGIELFRGGPGHDVLGTLFGEPREPVVAGMPATAMMRSRTVVPRATVPVVRTPQGRRITGRTTRALGGGAAARDRLHSTLPETTGQLIRFSVTPAGRGRAPP